MEYFADELTESLINGFSRIANLKVTARNIVFSYKNKKIELKKVGEKFGTTVVLTGRIRLIKNSLRFSVELVKCADGAQIWGTRLKRLFSEDLEVQESLAFEVLERLNSEIGFTTRC